MEDIEQRLADAINLYRFEIPETGQTISVKADSLKDCHKKLKRYFDDMFETKGRELKAIVYRDNLTVFEFCGRDITIKEVKE